LKNYLIILFLLFQFNSRTQNLIYNGDFEIYDTCPNNISTPGDIQFEYCNNWVNPTTATPDYFNSCANWPVNVPNNLGGYRTSHSGEGYCGLAIGYCYHPNGTCTQGWWDEFIQTELVTNLIQGYEYELKIYISFTNNLAFQYAFSKFGAYFSANAISRNDYKPFEFTPQIQNNSTDFLIDTGWIEFKRKFIANGDEKFVTLGFFIDTTNLDTLLRPENTDPVADWNYNSYYFLDDFSLIATGNIYSAPNVFTPNNDGINDNWIPFIFNEGDIVTIFNRWGVEIFNDQFPTGGWDGKTKTGEECSDGCYYFIIKKQNESNILSKGIIQLLH
jgi:gliding motility-associated-like protein